MNSNIPHLKSFDFNTLKKSHGKGTNKQTDRQTDRQTDIATSRPNRPVGQFSKKLSEFTILLTYMGFIKDLLACKGNEFNSIFQKD